MDDKTQLNTNIADDGLTAQLIMPEDFDRAALNASLCDAMLMRDGIELNAKTKELVAQFISAATAAPPGVFHALIAQGILPTHGKDAYVDWTIDTKSKPNENDSEKDGENDSENDGDSENVADSENDADSEDVSFYDRSTYTVVKVGDVLGQTHQPTLGVDGRDVTGKNLAASDGKPLDFKHDESIMIGQGNMILAQADGVLDRSSAVTCIRDTIEVDQYVDFNTGNINFNGSVVISKGVRDCFIVEADQDVEVRGLIEAATIIAGGDLRALGGFAGREQGKAQVTGDLHAKYLDAVHTHARGNLCVDREVINCINVVLGRIDSPRGSIIGGETHVAGAVEIGELGADGLPLTTVHVGVVPHLDPLIEELAAITESLLEQRQKLLDEQHLIEQTSGNRVLASHKERLCELMYEIAEVQTQLDRAEPSLQSARERAEAMRQIDIQVLKKVFPNTVLVCSGLQYKIKNELRGPLRITLDSRGQLQIERDGAKPAMLARNAELTEAA